MSYISEPMYCGYMTDCIQFRTEITAFCCVANAKSGIPRFPYINNAAESMQNFLEKRQIFIEELAGKRELDLANICIGCRNLKKGTPKRSHEKLKYLSFSLIPSPCQSKCIYCDLHKDPENNIENCKLSIWPERMVEMVNYLKINGHIADDCVFGLSPAEITLMPHKKYLLESLSGYKLHFLTNGFIFDRQLAGFLKNGSTLNVSLDSGTARTFSVVKGVNVFNKVIENIAKYRQCGDVTIKYIVIPGLNDSDDDMDGIQKIMSEIKPAIFILSADYLIPARASFYTLGRLATIAKHLNIPLTFAGKKFDINTLLDYAENIMPAHEAHMQKKSAYLADKFQKEYINDFTRYRSFIFEIELCELIRSLNQNTRICMIGDARKIKVMPPIIESIRQQKVLTAKDIQDAFLLNSDVDVFITQNKMQATSLRSLINDENKNVIPLDEYMNSLDKYKFDIMAWRNMFDEIYVY